MAAIVFSHTSHFLYSFYKNFDRIRRRKLYLAAYIYCSVGIYSLLYFGVYNIHELILPANYQKYKQFTAEWEQTTKNNNAINLLFYVCFAKYSSDTALSSHHVSIDHSESWEWLGLPAVVY